MGWVLYERASMLKTGTLRSRRAASRDTWAAAAAAAVTERVRILEAILLVVRILIASQHDLTGGCVQIAPRPFPIQPPDPVHSKQRFEATVTAQVVFSSYLSSVPSGRLLLVLQSANCHKKGIVVNHVLYLS